MTRETIHPFCHPFCLTETANTQPPFPKISSSIPYLPPFLPDPFFCLNFPGYLDSISQSMTSVSIIIKDLMLSNTFITPQGLVQLRNYKYKPGKYTKIDGLLNPYWQWVVTLIPEWVAPNLITFIGWVFVILSYVNMLRFDYTFQKDIPNWCFLFAAACIWIYSTLDAVDGKQARKTKSSSPLGQLFDHGCDSFSVTFFVLALGQAAKLEGAQVFMIFLACQSAFYSSNWTEYNTGILRTNVGQFGVTQAELISLFVHLLTGIFGQSLWQFKLKDILPVSISSHEMISEVMQLKLGGFIAYYMGGLIFLSCLYVFVTTIISSKDRIKPIRECLTFYLIVGLMLIWYSTSFYDQFKGMVLLNFGLLCSLIVCKVITSSVTKMKLPFFHLEVIPMLLFTILMVVCELGGLDSLKQPLFWASFGVNLLIILVFLTKTVNQITEFLGIYCFSLKKRPQIAAKSQ